MRVKEVRFFRAGNVIAAASGAVIVLEKIDTCLAISGPHLERWLRSFPCEFRYPWGLPSLLLPEAVQYLLIAFSDQARLQADPEPLRVLSQKDDELSLWLTLDDRLAALAASELTCYLLRSVLNGALPNQEIGKLWHGLCSRFWIQTHAHLARAAIQLGVPCYRLDRGGQQILQLGQGSRLRIFRETLTDQTPQLSGFASNKLGLHLLLRRRGVPLPAQEAALTLDQAMAAASKIGWPVVLKPADAAKEKGVWVGLSGPEKLRQAWQSNMALGVSLQLVQQMLSGADHRLLVINGQLMAVAQTQPAALMSDGHRTLREQIKVLNADPERGFDYERLFNRVPLDERLTLLLAEQGLSLDSVPSQGVRVQLSRTANLSQGGTAIDLSDQVHPDNRLLAEDVARLIGIDVVGLDFISQDLAVSWREGGTWLLEANRSPELRPHLAANRQTDLCRRIVREWMGEDKRAGRIPTALITGSIGKTTTSRLLAHLLQHSGLRVGLTTSTGMEFDGHVLESGDLAGGGPALQFLEDRRVEALVAEIARGGLLKAGLGLEQADVCGVLNILDNHIGMEGIKSRQDLARIKGLVAQAACDLLVLNADDPLVSGMGQQRAPGSLGWISSRSDPVWERHRRDGGMAAAYSNGPGGEVTIWRDAKQILSMAVEDIPASERGAVRAIAPAAAFAGLMALGLGLTGTEIEGGLRRFGLHAGHRTGRFEHLYESPWSLVLCSADGVEAMESVVTYAEEKGRALSPRRRVLMFSASDSRPDTFLRAMGRAVRGFDIVLCCAMDKRRGREVHEVPALLAEGVKSSQSSEPEILQLGVETAEGIDVLASVLRPGDFCVLVSFRTEVMKRRLHELLGPA